MFQVREVETAKRPPRRTEARKQITQSKFTPTSPETAIESCLASILTDFKTLHRS